MRVRVPVWLSVLLLATVTSLGHGLDATDDFTCQGVGVTIEFSGTWYTYAFNDAETSRPITAKLFADEVQGKDAAFVYRMGRWVELRQGEELVGSGLRIKHGTMVRVIFRYEQCLEIIEPKDK